MSALSNLQAALSQEQREDLERRVAQAAAALGLDDSEVPLTQRDETLVRTPTAKLRKLGQLRG